MVDRSQLEGWARFGAELADAAIVVHAPDTSVLWANRKASQLIGITRDELTGKLAGDPAFKLLDEHGAPLPLERYPVSLALDTLERIDDYVVGGIHPALDQRVWVKVTAEPVFEHAQLVVVVVTFVDITRQVEAENERRHAQERAEEANRLESLGLLAGGIAHDFNNLLVGILGAADTARSQLRDAGDASDDARRLLAVIKDSASRAANLTRQLMSFAGRGSAVIEVVEPNELVSEMARFVRGGLVASDALQYEPGEDVPPIEVDASQLRQVVLNLLANASDAVADESCPRVRVKTGRRRCSADELAALRSSGRPGSFATVTIVDNGVGMDEQTRSRIFEPYFTTKPEGTGLGLAAARGFVRECGGYLRVSSEPGRGAEFELGLPRTDKPRPRRRRDTGPRTAHHGEGRRVLIVDDELVVRRVLRRMLEPQGFEVAELEDGRTLLRELENRLPHVLILDLTMPGPSGAELLSEVRKRYPDLPVLIASGHADVDKRVSVEPGTPTTFLPKPFSQGELGNKLAALLSGDATA